LARSSQGKLQLQNRRSHLSGRTVQRVGSKGMFGSNNRLTVQAWSSSRIGYLNTDDYGLARVNRKLVNGDGPNPSSLFKSVLFSTCVKSNFTLLPCRSDCSGPLRIDVAPNALSSFYKSDSLCRSTFGFKVEHDNVYDSGKRNDARKPNHNSFSFLNLVSKRLISWLLITCAFFLMYAGLFCIYFFDSTDWDRWFKALRLNRRGARVRIVSGIAFILCSI
jgi:hypothetical protein